MLKEGMILSLLAGMCVGAVLVVKYKPARDAVKKTVDEVEAKAQKCLQKGKM